MNFIKTTHFSERVEGYPQKNVKTMNICSIEIDDFPLVPFLLRPLTCDPKFTIMNVNFGSHFRVRGKYYV